MGAEADEYERFVRARSPALLRCAYLLTGDQHLAEDLVQEALARTHRSWRRLYETGNAEAYARKIMYHAQVSIWRRRRVAESFPGTVADVEGRNTADHAEATVTRLAVEQALRALSPRQRAVIVLRFYEDRSEAEAAAVLGVAAGTVKTLASRALQRLRTFVPEIREFQATNGADR